MDDFDYKLKYQLFLAENEFFEAIISAGSLVSIFEDADIEAINESLEGQVNDYISKVLSSAQTAWNNFRNSVANKKDMEEFKKIAKTIKKSNPKFVINNFPVYNFQVLSTINVKPFNYASMKNDLKSKKAFYTKYYNTLVNKSKTSIVTGLNNAVLQSSNNVVHCDKKFLVETYNFCVHDFFNLREYIQKDIDTINTSSTSITTAMNTVVAAQEASIFYNDTVCNNIILEAPMITKGLNKPGRMTFSDNGGQTTNMGNKNQISSSKSFLRAVSVYMSVSMDIISTKMKILAKIYRNRKEIIDYFVEWADKNQKTGTAKKDSKKEIES